MTPLFILARFVILAALLLLGFSLFFGCAKYNAHVAAREDSLSGYAKESGDARGAGVAITHRVEYR